MKSLLFSYYFEPHPSQHNLGVNKSVSMFITIPNRYQQPKRRNGMDKSIVWFRFILIILFEAKFIIFYIE